MMYESSTFPRPNRGWRAFTLIELIVVLVITAMLAAVAVPRYTRFVGLRRLALVAGRITADIAQAQRHARFSATPHTVVFSPDTEAYSITGMPDPDHNDRDYQVPLALEPYKADIVAADFGGDAEIEFDVYGSPDSGGSLLVQVGLSQVVIEVDALTGSARIGSREAEGG